ncbi:dihydropteroate synthase [Gordonia sp. SL306]|uniref:dihydropteroate synthase n=1 Tax=Gordonia sp. SL306 TaxID=2995145 RepID=UPI00226E7B30|nr:dihydropteroate synthase [Gordonia sp. SL306]WAC58032.1 dihydropteroate synthase [Gordonia sp. SL306]
MGVINVTADSFSDGGRYLDHDAAIAHGHELIAQGADLIDIGGESTRPGASRVDPADEAKRVAPVIAGLAGAGVPISVDTMRAPVAAAAIEAGAAVINDVSGGRADADMARVVADAGLPWILMHWRPIDRDNRDGAFTHGIGDVGGYRDVVAEVSGELLAQVDSAVSAGVDPNRIVLDPGLGFAKTAEHNWALLHALPTFVGLGFPVLVGASRKRFLGTLLARDGELRPPAGREIATASISALAAMDGAWAVRVHDVEKSRDAVAVASAWRRGGSRGTGLPRRDTETHEADARGIDVQGADDTGVVSH